ncbi:MAG: hypothetical protein SGCHY_004221 [Lobulomycetales sp.]
MPRLASVGNPEVLSKRNAYFASLFQDREINDGNPKNLLQGHDEFLQDFKKAKEVLEQSNIWIPDPDTSNKNSYTNTRRKIFGNVIRDNLAKVEEKHIAFSDVVDIDEKEGIEIHVRQGLAARFGEGSAFRLFIFALIIANSIVIGLETDKYLESHGIVFFAVIDYVFLAFFTAEIALKCYYGLLAFWLNYWNWFDVFIVAAALAGPSIKFLANSRTLRILRVLRTLRSLRSVAFFQGLDMILQTIFESLPDLFYISILILLAMFIWGVTGVVLFSNVLYESFGHIGKVMFVLYVVLSGDGWVQVHNELTDRGQYLASTLYFGSFLIFGGFILQQLVVAVLVANLKDSLENADRKKQESKKKLLSDVKSTRGQKRFQKPIVEHPPPEANIWRKQIPLEVPNFDSFSAARLERYFVILSIVETNLAEFVELKDKISEFLEEVKGLQEGDASDMEEDDYMDDDDISVSDVDGSQDSDASAGNDVHDALDAFRMNMASKSSRLTMNASQLMNLS